MKTLFIKFWAFIYRCTGYYLPFIDYFIWKDVLEDNIDKIVNMSDDNDFPPSCGFGIEIGMWQSQWGFTRPWHTLNNFNQWAADHPPKLTNIQKLKRRLRAKWRKEASNENEKS